MGATRIDLDDLRTRATTAAAAWFPGVHVTDPAELPGGASSFTFVAHTDGTPEPLIVLKVAPAGVEPVRNRDVLRQARVLRALASRPGVAVPRVLFEDLGKPPEIPPFFAMTFVEGESLEPHIDAVDSLPPAGHIEARAFAAARMLAALHASAPDEIGLGGEPEVTTLEEIERWVRAFATVDDEFKRGTDDCAALLRKSMPDRIAPAIVHGDWRLGNMLCRGPELRAVIDWEIWARSDPRIDLAWYLLTASPAEHPSAKRDAPGMPRPDVLLAEYRAAGGAPADDINWFTALVLFKMAAVLALIVKNHRKRGDPHGYAAQVVPQIPIMVDRATAMLG